MTFGHASRSHLCNKSFEKAIDLWSRFAIALLQESPHPVESLRRAV
ncbi:MAG: hypothetical protein F6K63_19465 [Moorea sp. SIO1G6]|uniref:Uncharacterized protein n=1 Tax=Moorena producens (strain JHB) TaxID=1454205 RepID=A0A9Q9SUE8_MOOP1|nr:MULTISPECIES: hypothetical protein [Moorena]NET66446.1 hypothetical protein [Moorena sp. SIO1G6]WAN69881.1 hypothetical protein BJP36_37970 [Moorena producens JHB]